MKVPEPDEERPLAWTAILADTPVYSADEEEVGVVKDVVGSEDIFHGLVLAAGTLASDVLIAADKVTRITNRRIDTSMNAEDIRDLPPYAEEDSYQLGFVGLLGRRIGWVREGEHNHRGQS